MKCPRHFEANRSNSMKFVASAALDTLSERPVFQHISAPLCQIAHICEETWIQLATLNRQRN